MTANDFRRMALALDGVVEAAHMGHPDFRVGGKIFATLQHDMRTGMVTLASEDQSRFVADWPDIFSLAAGAWGTGGATLVTLAHADEEVVGEAMTLAWQRRKTPAPPRTAAARTGGAARKAVATRKPAPARRAAKTTAAKKR